MITFNSVAILNFDDVIKGNTKMAISFEQFIFRSWFLYEKCLIFCALSNELNFELIH